MDLAGPWVDRGDYFEREAENWAERRLAKNNELNLQSFADSKILDGVNADVHEISGLTACGIQSAAIEALLSRRRIAELEAQLAQMRGL